jgi:hypothetical protein
VCHEDGRGGAQEPETAVGAIKRIADQLGIHPEALRTWVKQAEVDAGDALPPAEPAGASTPINFDDPANPAVTCGDVVGDTGIEPVTSSVSMCAGFLRGGQL